MHRGQVVFIVTFIEFWCWCFRVSLHLWFQVFQSNANNMVSSNYFYLIICLLLYGCTTWTLTKHMEKKLDGNYIRMLRAILDKSWRQHSTKHQLYGHLHPITKTIKVGRTWHAGHYWRSRDELIRDVLLWTPSYGREKRRVTSSNLHTAAL